MNKYKQLLSFLKRLWLDMKQWRYPPEFRIKPAPVLPEIMPLINEIFNKLQTLSMTTSEKDQDLLSLIAELATGLWRIRNRISSLPDNDESIRRLKRVMKAVWEAMEANGVKIQEHTGEDYREGMALEVLTIETNPSLTQAKVIETIKPSVFVNGRLVQWAVVIVGKPPEEGGS
jgi:hypothetical protein